MKKTERKDFITTKLIIGEKKCNHCFRSVSNDFMWTVNRYNENGTYSTWYYSKECFQDKEELLAELDADSYPYGICPVDPYKKPNAKDFEWVKSESDENLAIICDFDILPNVNRPKVRRRTRNHK